MRIAIVDDNHTDRIFLREGLERILLKRNIENSEIHIFNSAEDILEYLKNEQETFFDFYGYIHGKINGCWRCKRDTKER